MSQAPYPFKSIADEKAFFEDIRQNAPGVISKHINKRISIPLSRLLLRTPITPNQITLFHAILGFIGVFWILHGTYIDIVIGSGLAWFSAVLDGCDGEVARAKNCGTEFGRQFDTISDLTKVFLYVVFIFFATAKAYNEPIYQKMGYAALLGCALLIVLFKILTSLSDQSKGRVVLLEQGYGKHLLELPLLGKLFSHIHVVLKVDFITFGYFVLALCNFNRFACEFTLFSITVESLVLCFFLWGKLKSSVARATNSPTNKAQSPS